MRVGSLRIAVLAVQAGRWAVQRWGAADTLGSRRMQQLIYPAFFVVLAVAIGGAILRWTQVSGLRQTGMRIAATCANIISATRP